MSTWDIVTLVVIGLFVIIGIWKGFLKLLLRFGASILAIVLAKTFGGMLGKALIPSLIQSDRLSAEALERVNSILATVIGTVALFLVLFLVLKLIAGLLAKILTNAFHVSALDRLLGAVVGLIGGLAVVCLIAVAVNVYALVATFINPDAAILATIEDTYIFKYFFGILL